MIISSLLDTPGAVAGESGTVAEGVAGHYGDPLREARLLEEGLAVVDLGNRGIVTVDGPDRLTWLHSLTTQRLADLPPRTSTSSLVLSPKGHIEHDLHIVDDGERTWITVEPGTTDALTSWLDSMRFMLRVEVTDVSGAFAVLGEPIRVESVPGEPIAWVDSWPGPVGDTAVYGLDGSGGRKSSASRAVPRADTVDDGAFIHPGLDRPWRELIVPRADVRDHVGDRPLAGVLAVESLRVAAWRPRLGAETDHRSIPHELDWLRVAVHLHKGCYRGQETMARVHNLGRPPRRLLFAHIDGSGHVLPAAGTELTLSGRAVGRLTSVARHHVDGPIGLGVVKRNIPVDADLLADGTAVAQTAIVQP